MQHILFEQDGPLGILRINRPEALNALNSSLIEEIAAFLRQPEVPESIKLLILTGQGEKAFIAGADIQEMKDLSPKEAQKFASLGQELTLQIEKAPFVTIAAVNGFALGGGFEIALSCDFIYASTKAVFGLPEVSLGLIPGFGGTHRLSRLVGVPRAKELIFRAQHIDAEESLELGIANAIYPSAELLKECKQVGKEILKNSHAAVLRAKQTINKGYSLSVLEALAIEQQNFEECFHHPDRKEGLHAFTEKRQAKFR